MDAITKVETRFLPAVADAVNEWLPELEGRAIAVSDVDITMENVPKLPIALIAFTQSVGHQLIRSRSNSFEITDTFVIDFWLQPTRVKHKGKDTPYWNYYPYEFVRDKLLIGFLDFTGPNGEHVAYRGLRVEADPLAARLTFTFIATFQWCYDDQRQAECLADVGFRLCTPASCIPDPVCPEEEERCLDPCR